MSKSEESWDTLSQLEPIHFFAIGADISYYKEKKLAPLSRKYLLPSLEPFYEERPFVEVAMAWNEEGIFLTISANHTPEISYPNYQQGDSVELFFDTRDIKNSVTVHKFCHHFFFLPEPYEEDGLSVQAGEVSRFRGEDRHELADANKLILQSSKKKGYNLTIFIPAECLFGYDPLSFDRLGFSYRINRVRKEPQFFAVAQTELVIEQQPSLWASMKLVKG